MLDKIRARMFRLLHLVILCGIGIVAFSAQRLGRPEILTPCQIVAGCNLWDNQLVKVRGGWATGLHGEAINSRDCSLSNVAGEIVPPALDFDFYDDSVLPRTLPIDERSRDRFGELQEQLALRRPKGDYEIEITVEGELKCAKNFKLEKNENQTLIGNGFGFMGRFPAMLLVTKFYDMEVKEKPRRRQPDLPE